jgi:hypothetical protein
VVLPLPARPKTGLLRVACRLAAPGGRAVSGTLEVRRG